MKKKYYYTYKILCNHKPFENKYYFGKHETNNLDDGYICSSSVIGKWCHKHPNYFTKTILNFYDSREELDKAEYELIHPHLCEEDCLNICEGGLGCTCYGEANGMYGKKLKDLMTDEEWELWLKHKSEAMIGHNVSETCRKNISKANKNREITKEWRSKIKDSLTEYYKDPENRKKAGEKNKGKTHKCPFAGKHRVYDNKELNIYHYE